MTLTGCQSASSSSAAKSAPLPTIAAVGDNAKAELENGSVKISAAQRRDVADGTVSYDEYQAALQRLRSCMQADGFDLNLAPEVNQMRRGSMTDAANPSYERCYPLEFGLVDGAWQGYRENFGADAKAMAECVRSHGKTPRLTLKEKYEQLAGMGIDPYKQCPGVTGGG